MKPIIALTMGDPAGIGPEILLKALTNKSLLSRCRPLVIGDYTFLKACRVSSRLYPVHLSSSPSDWKWSKAIPVVDFQNVDLDEFKWGKVSASNGKASGDYIEYAILLALGKKIDAIVTGPINKYAFRLGGWGKKFTGHTEMLTAMTKSRQSALMLTHRHFRAVHVTSHISVKAVPSALSRQRILETIELTNDGLRRMGIRRPRIAVCGLNPHAGDNGLMGLEEAAIIAPAVRAAKKKQIAVEGPLAADTLWPLVAAKKFDAGVAMYHDQGQIALKLFAAETHAGDVVLNGVNVTLGLPIIRTSVAHGTAYDIAGKGEASEKSLVEAVLLAAQMAKR